MKRSLLAAAFVTFCTGALAQTPTLTVYTYDSFVSEWGPGPLVKEAFEATCECNLEFIGAGDGAALLSRLKLEGERTKADVVLGLDTNLSASAKDTGLFAPHGLEAGDTVLPIEWNDEVFLPFDWGYFAFVYDKNTVENPPESFADLLASDHSIIIQDPRSSTPGLGLLLWVKEVYGDDAADVWAKLAPRIVTVTKGWSEAYGMFLEGEADLVLSYTTSPAYHLLAEEDDSKAAAIFSEGHYMQIELTGKIASTDQGELADKFLEFTMSETFQSIIPTTNWMYPATLPFEQLPDGFVTDLPETSLLIPEDEVEAIKGTALSEWLTALSK